MEWRMGKIKEGKKELLKCITVKECINVGTFAMRFFLSFFGILQSKLEITS